MENPKLLLRFYSDFDNANDFVMRAQSICDRLNFGVEAELFEQGLQDVARLIGIASSRPEKETGRGPDCLWLGENGQFRLLEAKSEVDLGRREIYKSETEQLLHSCEWFAQEYGGKSAVPLMFHPATVLAKEAVYPKRGRVVTPEVLEKFVESVRSYVATVASRDRGAISEKAIREALQANSLHFNFCFSNAKETGRG